MNPQTTPDDGPVIAPPPPVGTVPGPGVYRDVLPAEYHAWPLVNAGLLGELDRSPRNARYAMDNPSPETPALKLGRAFHSLLLEPAEHAGRYVTAGPCAMMLKSGDRSGQPCGAPGVRRFGSEWFCGTHGKRQARDGEGGDPEVIRPEDALTITNMANAVRLHPWAKRALAMPALAEVSIVWDDEVTGVRCKARADWLVTQAGYQFCMDVKTTGDGSRAAFSRDCANYGYHRRAAFYLRGLNAAGFRAGKYVLLAVEKSPPHVVRAYEVDIGAIVAGEMEVSRLLADYARCRDTGDWDGADAVLQKIDLPAWAKPRDEPAEPFPL